MQIERDVSLKPYNTLALEARASAMARVNNEAELREAIGWASANSLPVVPLGQGSNVVLAGDLEALDETDLFRAELENLQSHLVVLDEVLNKVRNRARSLHLLFPGT